MARRRWADSYEVILVDVGSNDRSWEFIKQLHEKDQRIKGINFSRNFGHQAAVLAGLNYSTGHYTVLMDGDLQDQPEEIPKLVEKVKAGNDIVQGITPKRHANPRQDCMSKAFHRLFVSISTIDPRTRLGLFRYLSRPVVEAIKKLPERALFLGGIISWVGFTTVHVPVTRAERYAGKSKYSFFKRFALAINAISSFSERPLIFIFQHAIAVFIFSIIMFIYVIFKKIFYNIWVIGWTSLFAAIFFSDRPYYLES